MSETPESGRSWRRLVAAFAAGVALSVAVGLALLGGGADTPAPEPSPAIPAPAPSEAAPAPPVPPSPPPARAPTYSVASAKTLVLERAAFPASGPVRVSLELPEMSADVEPRPVRLVSQPDHRILELRGAVGSDRTAATIDVDPGYLQPGTYLVEVQTTERGAMPLRRYFIIVR